MKMTRILSLMLVVMMLTAMFVTTALADDSVTITIDNEAPNHVYEAYQVFTGKLSSTGKLSDVQWGSGVNGDALLAALKTCDLFLKDGVNQFAGCASAEAVSKIIAGWSYNEAPVKHFADEVAKHLTSTCSTSSAQSNNQYVINVGTVGYYFVKDKNAVTGNDAATDYLLHVAKSVHVSPKISVPTFIKTVNNELNTSYHDAIDAQIGDTLYFKLEAKLPSLYNDYHQYVMIMEDVLPEGLEFNQVEDIYIAHAAGGHTSYMNNDANTITANKLYNQNNNTNRTSEYAKFYGFKDNKLTVNFGDLKKTQQNPNLNDTYVVKYSVTVTSDAVYGLNRTGETNDGTENNMGNQNTATLLTSNNMNQTIAYPAEGETATGDLYAGIQLGSLSDTANVYVYQLKVTKVDSQTKAPLAGATFRLYRNVTNPNGGDPIKTYAHTDANGVITAWNITEPQNVLTSGEDGTFVIKGLDALAYHLEEVQAPEGYNTMTESVLVTVNATLTGHALTALTATADGTTTAGILNNGMVAISVNNTAGATLPETGGTGTTIFYVAGVALLVAVAVVFMVRKRRDA